MDEVTSPSRYDFRIVRKSGRHPWRVETWDAEPPYGPAWQPLYSGFDSLAEIRAAFAGPDGWHGVVFESDTTGWFPSQS